MKKLLLLALALVSVSIASKANAAALGVADTFALTKGQSISALFHNSNDWIQTYGAINSTDGAVSFGVGAAYKFTVAGTAASGFHVGPGISMGTDGNVISNQFYFTVHALAGFHYTAWDRVIVSADAGPIVYITKGKTDFSVRPIGNLLGLSLHYLF